jgi:hypothetical protein
MASGRIKATSLHPAASYTRLEHQRANYSRSRWLIRIELAATGRTPRLPVWPAMRRLQRQFSASFASPKAATKIGIDSSWQPPKTYRIYIMRPAGGLLPVQHSEGKSRAREAATATWRRASIRLSQEILERANVRFGSIASFQTGTRQFRFSSDSGHILQSREPMQ